jgi:tripartite-type tricarboxylate transporter receptor subunit TctC
MLGDQLSTTFSQQSVIENRAGAGGNIATELAARAKPDGHTLVLPAMAYAVNPSLYNKVPYRFSDFTPLTIVAKGPLVLAVHPSLAARSVAELLALARAKPGAIDYGSGGNGSSLHLAAELFKYQAAVNLNHVPYKGTNDLVPDLIGGRVPVAFISPLIADGHVKAQRLRALGVTSPRRATGWPDLPTVAEAGVKGYEFDAWYALLVPAATPAAIVDRLSRAVIQGLRAPEVQGKLASLGVEAVANSPQEAAAYIAAEAKKWDTVLRAANIRID